METLLLGAALKNRNAYFTAAPLIETNDFAPMSQMIWGVIGEYYERDTDAETVNRETLAKLLESRFTNPKHFELCKRMLEQIPSDVSADNVVELVRENRRVKVGLSLAAALSTNNKESIAELLPCYLDIKSDSSESDSEILTQVSTASLFSTSGRTSLIQMAPKSLNDKLEGGCLRGHCVLIYARPECGKTLLLINLLASFLRQGLRVLYLANEEPLPLTLQRVLSRLSGMPKSQLRDEPERADSLAADAGYANLFAKYDGGMTLEAIEQYIEEVKPDVCIVDQMRNVVSSNDNRANQLETVARGLRSLAGKHNLLMIESTQAGDSAEGKLVLEMGDVDWSNTGIPGAVDLMIGIGKNKEYEDMGQRMLSLPKNKVSGDHGYFPVQIDTQLSKVSSI